MQTEMRAINLGKRGGIVARRFFGFDAHTYYNPVKTTLEAYRIGVITRGEARRILKDIGFAPDARDYLLRTVERR